MNAGLASWTFAHYIIEAGLRGALGANIPGALSILEGAVPDRARGLGHMAPTYFRREPGIERSDGRCGSALARCGSAPATSLWLRFCSVGLAPAMNVFRLAAPKTRMPGRIQGVTEHGLNFNAADY